MTEMTKTPSDDVMILLILTSRSFKRVLHYILSDQTRGTNLLVLLRSVLLSGKNLLLVLQLLSGKMNTLRL